LKNKDKGENMRISRASGAVAAASAMLFASQDACAALKVIPPAGKVVRASLRVTCAVLPKPQPVVTIKIEGGTKLTTIEY
jgi:hypothetical protein